MRSDIGDELGLWQRSLKHDDRAFAGLFDQHRDRVFRHVLRLVDSPTDAEDVTAAAFFELWNRRAKVRVVNDSVLPWLLVTATNLARNTTRRTRRYATLIASLPRTHESLDPADLIVDAETRQATRTTITTIFTALRDTDVALLCVVVLEDQNLIVAADALGISHAAARTRLHRLKAQARALLEADVDPTPGILPTLEGKPRS